MMGLTAYLRPEGAHADAGARMLGTLGHRGRAHGLWAGAHVVLGQRADDGDARPVADTETGCVVVADARLDRGPWPSDAHAILAAYARWGEACVEHLRGDFAFALWDARRRVLFCARDAFGVKPLFHWTGPDGSFACASEIKSLLALPHVPRRVEETRIADYLVELDEDPELTFFEGIRRLPAGHCLAFAGTPARPRRWWHPAAAAPPACRSADDWAEGLRARIEAAVAARLEGPVASMLSGGLDTSSIVGVARRLRSPLPTLSVRFDDHPEADESRWFEAVIRGGGVAPRVIPGADVRPDELLPRFLAREDEPLWAPYVFLHAAVYNAARRAGAGAVLDGLEGDATVSFGWGRLPQLAARGRFLTLARELALLARRTGRRPLRLVRAHCIQPFVPAAARRAWRALRGREPWWLEGSIIRRGFARRVGLRERFGEFERRCLPPRSAAAEHEGDLASPGLAHCCEMFDGAGTLFGIEPRHPFLDRDLAEFCLAVPPELKLRDGYPRWLQRAAMRGLLPEEVRLRPNKNRTSPGYARRLLRCGERALFDIVMERRELVAEYVDLERVRAARDRFAAGGELADAKRVWYAGQLALWLSRVESEGVRT